MTNEHSLLLSPFAVIAVSLGTALGCASKTPPPKEPTAESPTTKDEALVLTADSEIGGMNEEASDAAFRQASSKLQGCYEAGQSRIELLAGEVNFLVRVDHSGTGTPVIERSTLGDLETERCMVKVLAAQKWPPPVGGRIGEARRPFVFEAPSDLRPAVDWNVEEIEDVLADLSETISQCKGTSGESFEATIYVDRDGTVLSAGMAASDSGSLGVAECLTDALRRATFPSPGSWPAKATFAL